jgi:hypothetical protein
MKTCGAVEVDYLQVPERKERKNDTKEGKKEKGVMLTNTWR